MNLFEGASSCKAALAVNSGCASRPGVVNAYIKRRLKPSEVSTAKLA